MTFDQWKDKVQGALDAVGAGSVEDFDDKYLAWAFGEDQNPQMVARAYIKRGSTTPSSVRRKPPAAPMGLTVIYVVGTGGGYVFWALAVVNLFMAATDAGKMSAVSTGSKPDFTATAMGDAASKLVWTYSVGGTVALIFAGLLMYAIGQVAREYGHQAT